MKLRHLKDFNKINIPKAKNKIYYLTLKIIVLELETINKMLVKKKRNFKT
jgi:hypothetical protein